MKRLRRLLLMLVSTIAVLSVAAALGYFAFRKPIARYAVERVLRGAGFAHATFNVRSVSLSDIDLAGVQLRGPDMGTIGSVRATYSLGALLKGRVHSLTIQHAELHTAEDSQPPAQPHEFGALQALDPPFDLPLDHIVLRDVAVTIPYAGQPRRVILNGTVERVSPNVFHADLGVVGDDNLIVTSNGVQLGGLMLQAHVSIRGSRRETVISAREGTIIGIDRVAIASAAATDASTAVRLVLEPIDGEPLLRIGRSAGQPMIRAAAEFNSTAAITIEGEAGHAFIPRLSAAGHIQQGAGEGPIVRMDLGVHGASIRMPELNLAVTGLSAMVPVDFNVPVARRGPVSAEAVVFRGAQFNDFSGSAGVAEGYLDSDIEGALGGGAQLAVNAAFDFNEGLAGDIAAFIPRFQLTDAELIRRIIPELRDAQIGGTYTADAQFLLRDGQIDPYVHIKAADARIYNTQWPLAIDAADAEVTITSLAPLRAPPGQRIAIRQARVGQIEVDGGEILFGVQERNGVMVEDIHWTMGAYGRFRASPFAFQLLEPNFQTNIEAADVGLGAWLDLLSNGRAASDGQLHGSVALQIDSSQRQPLRIMSGHLQSQQPAANVNVEDARMLGRFLDRNMENQVADEQWQLIRTRLVDALAEYRYDALRLDFIPEDDDVLCRIQTSGRGRSGADGQEIGLLTIHVRNFNDLLNEVLLFRSALGRRE